MNDQMLLQRALDAWQLPGPLRIEPLEGGMNSRAWRVETGEKEDARARAARRKDVTS